MSIVKQAETAMDKQIWESVHIDSLAAEAPTSCLNLKSELGHSKDPSLETKTRPPRQPKIPTGKRGKGEDE